MTDVTIQSNSNVAITLKLEIGDTEILVSKKELNSLTEEAQKKLGSIKDKLNDGFILQTPKQFAKEGVELGTLTEFGEALTEFIPGGISLPDTDKWPAPLSTAAGVMTSAKITLYEATLIRYKEGSSNKFSAAISVGAKLGDDIPTLGGIKIKEIIVDYNNIPN
ncbi:MAG: hypothetical protein KUG82_15460 [Pseudomonadales bacterium]|nr:hypothetical protein [Pseudomonadales bacterium]